MNLQKKIKRSWTLSESGLYAMKPTILFFREDTPDDIRKERETFKKIQLGRLTADAPPSARMVVFVCPF